MDKYELPPENYDAQPEYEAQPPHDEQLDYEQLDYDEQPQYDEQLDYEQLDYDEQPPYGARAGYEAQPQEAYYADDPLPGRRPHTILKPRTQKPNFLLAVLVSSVKLMIMLVLMLSLAGAGALIGIAKAYVETAPTLNLAKLDAQAKTSFIYDAEGRMITDYKGTEDRVMVSLAEIPTALQNAFVAVEDARFFTHNGVDVKRIVGAFISNFSSSSQQGGSTITQQLIKQTVLSDEQSYKRKLQEAYLAMQLEGKYTKEQILESYLNTIFLGGNYYGVKVAAQGYFGKDLSQLTLRECAMLAGLTRSPNYYDPRKNFYTRNTGNADTPKITNERTDYVLRMMYESQFITEDIYRASLDTATANVLEVNPYASTEMYDYAYYVEYAISDVVSKFLELNNLENTSANRYAMENKLRTGGYKVYLCLDTQIQTLLEDTLANWDKYPRLRNPSDKVHRARNADGTYTEIPQPQAAAVVYDYRTGELKAIVGGRYKPTQRKTLNRANGMKMPVGSSIKPIAVYAPAIDLGASPASVIYNMPVPIKGWKDSKLKDSFPQNYGGGNYTGAETFREALRRSHNTGAAQALMYYVGIERSAEYLKQLGVSPDNINADGFGLALGSSGITPVQMAVAFGTLANKGVYLQPLSFSKILDSAGNVVIDMHATQAKRQVFKPATAMLVVDMLKGAVASGTGTSAKISSQVVAGKTGTNSDSKGVFFAGMTGWYAASLWVGHDGYKPLTTKATGGNDAAPLWQSFMEKIHKAKGLDKREIIDGDPADYGLVKVTTCGVSGQLATEACKHDLMGYKTVSDYWYSEDVPKQQCVMHRTVTVCTVSNMLAGSYCPPEAVENRGAILIPKGHPLYDYTSSYASVIREKLGPFATIGGDNDNINRTVCDVHTAQWQQQQQEQQGSNLTEQAQALVNEAYNRLGVLGDSLDAAVRDQVNAAISAVETVLYSGALNPTTLYNAVENLRNAMNMMP